MSAFTLVVALLALSNTGSRYEVVVVEEGVTWGDAKVMAEDMGGHLAT